MQHDLMLRLVTGKAGLEQIYAANAELKQIIKELKELKDIEA